MLGSVLRGVIQRLIKFFPFQQQYIFIHHCLQYVLENFYPFLVSQQQQQQQTPNRPLSSPNSHLPFGSSMSSPIGGIPGWSSRIVNSSNNMNMTPNWNTQSQQQQQQSTTPMMPKIEVHHPLHHQNDAFLVEDDDDADEGIAESGLWCHEWRSKSITPPNCTEQRNSPNPKLNLVWIGSSFYSTKSPTLSFISLFILSKTFKNLEFYNFQKMAKNEGFPTSSILSPQISNFHPILLNVLKLGNFWSDFFDLKKQNWMDFPPKIGRILLVLPANRLENNEAPKLRMAIYLPFPLHSSLLSINCNPLNQHSGYIAITVFFSIHLPLINCVYLIHRVRIFFLKFFENENLRVLPILKSENKSWPK